MTNALINERKEELEERLNNKDRELSELKVPTFLYTVIFPGSPPSVADPDPVSGIQCLFDPGIRDG
jgi:hypothetical protein